MTKRVNSRVENYRASIKKDLANVKQKGRAFYKFWIENNIAIPLDVKIKDDFDELVEFVLINSPYSEKELLSKDIIDFYKILYRCEERIQRQIEEIEKNNK